MAKAPEAKQDDPPKPSAEDPANPPADPPAGDTDLDDDDDAAPRGEDTSEFDDAFAEHAADEPEDDDGAEPEPEPAPDPKADPDPAPAPAAAKQPPAPTDDIWAEATEAQKAAYRAASIDAHKWRSDQGRAAADRRRIAELEAQVNGGGANQAPPKDSAVMQVLEGDAWKTVEKELPELAAPLKEILTGVANENATLNRRLATFDADHAERVASAQIEIVAQAHPDWEAVTDSKAFAEWVVTQPNYVQQMVHRNGEKVVDGEEAAHLVSLYKASDGYKPPSPPQPATAPAPTSAPAAKPAPQPAAQATPSAAPAAPSKQDRTRQRRLAAHTKVPPTGPGASSGAPDNFDDAFEHYARAG